MISGSRSDAGSRPGPSRPALVTGAAGFLGTVLASRLAAAGFGVAAIDVRTPGGSAAEGIRYRRADLLDFGTLPGLVGEAAGERPGDCVVFHLAGESHVGNCRRDPLRAHALNVAVTAHLLEACRRAGVRRVVFPSTALVYRDPSRKPLDEGAPVAAGSVYAATKLAAEALLAGYAADHGFSCDVARLGNVYGPGAHGDSVVHILLSPARAGGPLEVERLSPVRDFVYRDDVVDGLAALGAAGGDPGFRVFNLSSGRAVSIRELALSVCRAAGLAEEVGEKGPPDARRDDAIVLSIRRIREHARWRPAWTLEGGLAQTLSEAGRETR